MQNYGLVMQYILSLPKETTDVLTGTAIGLYSTLIRKNLKVQMT